MHNSHRVESKFIFSAENILFFVITDQKFDDNEISVRKIPSVHLGVQSMAQQGRDKRPNPRRLVMPFSTFNPKILKYKCLNVFLT